MGERGLSARQRERRSPVAVFYRPSFFFDEEFVVGCCVFCQGRRPPSPRAARWLQNTSDRVKRKVLQTLDEVKEEAMAMVAETSALVEGAFAHVSAESTRTLALRCGAVGVFFSGRGVLFISPHPPTFQYPRTSYPPLTPQKEHDTYLLYDLGRQASRIGDQHVHEHQHEAVSFQ